MAPCTPRACHTRALHMMMCSRVKGRLGVRWACKAGRERGTWERSGAQGPHLVLAVWVPPAPVDCCLLAGVQGMWCVAHVAAVRKSAGAARDVFPLPSTFCSLCTHCVSPYEYKGLACIVACMASRPLHPLAAAAAGVTAAADWGSTDAWSLCTGTGGCARNRAARAAVRKRCHAREFLHWGCSRARERLPLACMDACHVRQHGS